MTRPRSLKSQLGCLVKFQLNPKALRVAADIPPLILRLSTILESMTLVDVALSRLLGGTGSEGGSNLGRAIFRWNLRDSSRSTAWKFL